MPCVVDHEHRAGSRRHRIEGVDDVLHRRNRALIAREGGGSESGDVKCGEGMAAQPLDAADPHRTSTSLLQPGRCGVQEARLAASCPSDDVDGCALRDQVEEGREFAVASSERERRRRERRPSIEQHV